MKHAARYQPSLEVENDATCAGPPLRFQTVVPTAMLVTDNLPQTRLSEHAHL